MKYLALCLILTSSAFASDWERVVIDDDLPGAYQVEVADVNGDGRPDVVALGGGTCAWYQNPSWRKRVVSSPGQTPGVISTAAADLDGDGKAEIAIAYEFEMTRPTQGKLALATQGAKPDDPWTIRHVADVGSIHRLRWGDVDGDKRLDLVVAPIFGPAAKGPAYDQDRSRLAVFQTGARPKTDRWVMSRVGDGAPVLHAIEVIDLDGDGRSDILAASNEGVTRFALRADRVFQAPALAPGAPGSAPKKGSSEVHVGRLKDGRRLLATVDPWHGNEVAVCLSAGPDLNGPRPFGPRLVIDDTLSDGHALWVADFDGDGDDEIIAGHRGTDHRVSAYDFDGKTWTRTVIDKKIAAQDLRGGDLDGDGRPDVVAVGGSTHNVIWYRPRRPAH